MLKIDKENTFSYDLTSELKLLAPREMTIEDIAEIKRDGTNRNFLHDGKVVIYNHWTECVIVKKISDLMKELLKLLNERNISTFEITSLHYGYCLNNGKLKQLIIYDRFIHDPSQFNKLGYGIISRSSK